MIVGKLALGELNKSQFGGTRLEAKKTVRRQDLSQDGGGREVKESWWIQDIRGGRVCEGCSEDQGGIKPDSWILDLGNGWQPSTETVNAGSLVKKKFGKILAHKKNIEMVSSHLASTWSN